MTMKLEYTAEQLAFAAEARSWLEANVPKDRLPSMDTEAGFAAHREWEQQLSDGRWSVVSWPAEFGGRDVGLVEWVLFEEEYYRAGAPTRVAQNGISLLAPIIFGHGTPEQQQRWLPGLTDGSIIWAQAWSEPGAGSDLAAIRSTATRDDSRGGWVLNGQKIWSSRAVWADRGFGLFRSDPAAQRHHGLTYYTFPLDAPGITVRAIEQLDGGTGFAEIFFDDVFVPDADVLGGIGDGWRVAMSTAGNERGLSLRAPGRFLAAADNLVALANTSAAAGADISAATRERVAEAWIDAEAYRLFTWHTVSRALVGEEVGSEGSINKVFWSELDRDLHETALELRGAEAEVKTGDHGSWVDDYLFSVAGPIYAGTNEIQRNIIAERILGLPRGDRRKN
ncbi:alkylation response protein AidB-like acyl-CoA dehydrogenase [Leucobacter exalbidus]|uniref:Alkylation response protein AidB-like acyl-CoA dehydrogenase n=1 Tax=Leucobacter exalbidus TaxID=662960 RepID=A0A940PTK5_9MICO|nr:acyl-CoA dehydrogenase family protein [Leucobacter exalbidus]MBP1325970.1 alkylation response protein AidB-like acyl-CoA dehydrogenase [Leucobacter exalbidus]